MRQIALDTETTGIDVAAGNRIVEIGAIEICERCLTGRSFHAYLNPGRASEAGALAVHGLSEDFLADKPRFAEVVDAFLAFVEGAELLIHNASFDLAFLNHELALAGHERRLEEHCPVVDTLRLAREKHPGQRNSLDALCRRYDIDHSARTLHGALLDARLLVEVYLAMTAGQGALDLASTPTSPLLPRLEVAGKVQALPLRRSSAEELAAHEARLQALERASGRQALFRAWMA